jgi:RNA polymerase sigma-70 factor (ECF subfamily)
MMGTRLLDPDPVVAASARREEPGSGGRPPEGDAELLRAYQAGDVTAFERLFTRYSGRLRGTCARYLSEDDQLDDVVQETFLRLLRVADRVDADFRVSAWLHRVAINICLDQIRHRRRVELVDLEEPRPDIALLCDRDERPDEAWEMSEVVRQMARIAGTLPERQRRAFVLREIHGLSYSDIARRLGISSGAVETLLVRARERFRREYLRLEGVEPTQCALVRHMIEVVGAQRLGAHRSRLVQRHVAECAACRARVTSPPSPEADADSSRRESGHRAPPGR